MVTDLLLHDNRFTEFTSPRLPIKVHGSGCTLSSYIAGHLAKGCDMVRAVAGSKRRVQDAIALSSALGKGMNIVNPMATKQKEAMRYPHIEALRKAVWTIESRLPGSFIPESGMDLVYALPNPQDFTEICCVEGKIQRSEDRPIHAGDIVFGSCGWISRTIMSINLERPELLAGLELRYSASNEDSLLERGMAIVRVTEDAAGQVHLIGENAIDCQFEQLGLVSGALFKLERMGKESRMGIIGKDPDDLLRRIGPCLDG